MAGEEESTGFPVSNSQRTVLGFFLSAPVKGRHKHKANKAMKMGFIDYPLMNPLGLCGLPLLFADLLDRVQMNEGALLVADHDIKKPVPIYIARGHLRAHA